MKRFALLAAALALTAGCTPDSSASSGTTRARVYLTDAPFPFDSVERVDVYIAKVEASTTLDTGQTGGEGWVTLAEPLRTFNLLDYQGGASVLAGEADIPAGQYRAIRLTINTSLSHLIDINGAEMSVIWPVQGELALNAYVEHALDVGGEDAQIVIDFDVGRSFLLAESSPPQLVFSPWIRAINEVATGSIAGVITGPDVEGNQTPLPDVNVLVMTTGSLAMAGSIVATGRTNAQGQYLIAFLAAGQYGVAPQPPSFYGFRGATATVQVAAGLQTVASFQLSRDTLGGPGIDTSTVTPGGPVASVTLRVGSPGGVTALATCDSVPLSVELRNASGQILLGRQVSWAVSDSAIIRLEGVFGMFAHLRAMQAGSASVTAVSEGRSASVTFTVTGATCTTGGGGGGGGTTPVANVTLSPGILNPAVGDSIGSYAVLTGASGQPITGRPVSFAVSDTSVVGIMGVFGQSVILRAKKVGAATLTATSEGKSGTASITVH